MASSSNQRRAPLANLDRLSSLPVELINIILKRVPLKDVVRTKALSKFCRCRWMLVPDLIFDARSIPPSWINRADFVNHVLFLHDGNVFRFEISNYLDCISPDVDRWLQSLARKSVRELILEFPMGNRYKLLSSLFLCQNLRLLKLHCSILSMPSHVNGFCNLVDLDLRQVTLTNETIAILIINCPLQRLILFSCDGFNRINIYSPSLQVFYFHGPCASLNFGNTPNLVFAYMGVLPLAGQVEVARHNGVSRNLEDILGGLINVRKLHVLKHFLEILVSCRVTETSCITFPHLSYLSLEMNLDDWKEVSTSISLLRSSPCLTTMTITNCSSAQVIHLRGGDSMQAELCGGSGIFPRLTAMTLNGFKGRQFEMIFLQLILSKARLLQTISIAWEINGVETLQGKARVLENMMQFERASPIAKVVFLNHA